MKSYMIDCKICAYRPERRGNVYTCMLCENFNCWAKDPEVASYKHSTKKATPKTKKNRRDCKICIYRPEHHGHPYACMQCEDFNSWTEDPKVAFYKRSTKRATKNYICKVCKGKIHRNEGYVRHKGFVNGRYYTCELHLKCDKDVLDDSYSSNSNNPHIVLGLMEYHELKKRMLKLPPLPF